MKHLSIASARTMPFLPDFDQAATSFPHSSMPDSVACALVRETQDRVYLVDAGGSLLWANASALRASGALLPLSGGRWDRLWPGAHRPAAAVALREACSRGHATFDAELHALGAGPSHWTVVLTRVSQPNDAGYLVIALARESHGCDSAVSADRPPVNRDGPTGLPNAVALHEELSIRTKGAMPLAAFALVAMDLDGFGEINGRAGPQASDAMLVRFAALLAAAAGPSCFLARSGGDEFTLLVDDPDDSVDLLASIVRIIRECAEQASGADQALRLSVSAGAARFPADAATDRELVRFANEALRAAKAGGRGRCLGFDGTMRQRLQRHSSMLEVARAAVAGDWVSPYYQPKVDLVSGRVVGLEALLRWRSADGSVHAPASIAAAFDDPQIAARIRNVMLTKVIADIRAWRQLGMALPVAINASAADFLDGDFAQTLLGQLGDAGLAASLLELEVTEGVFMGAGAEQVSAALRSLNTAGMRIALDDFGTGYASLTHLKEYPVDVIKIDKSFISDLAGSSGDRAIVSAMIGLGRNLAIEVVAEGIETAGQLSILRDLGCQTGQEFAFSRAVPGADVTGIAGAYRLDGLGGSDDDFMCAIGT